MLTYFEKLQQKCLVKFIGMSNFNYGQLELLYKNASVKPIFIQNISFAKQIGILPLTGTSSAEHMQLDLKSNFLQQQQVDDLEYLSLRI